MTMHWPPGRIGALRRSLGDSVAEFSARFARSPRTIEDWEQGRRKPDALCLRMLDSLALQIPLDSDTAMP